MKDKAERSRPNFKDVFGAERTLEDVQEALISQPQLYDYIRQLDEYVDYLDQQSKEEAKERYDKAIEYWNNTVVPKIPNKILMDGPQPCEIRKALRIASGIDD